MAGQLSPDERDSFYEVFGQALEGRIAFWKEHPILNPYDYDFDGDGREKFLEDVMEGRQLAKGESSPPGDVAKEVNLAQETVTDQPNLFLGLGMLLEKYPPKRAVFILCFGVDILMEICDDMKQVYQHGNFSRFDIVLNWHSWRDMGLTLSDLERLIVQLGKLVPAQELMRLAMDLERLHHLYLNRHLMEDGQVFGHSSPHKITTYEQYIARWIIDYAARQNEREQDHWLLLPMSYFDEEFKKRVVDVGDAQYSTEQCNLLLFHPFTEMRANPPGMSILSFEANLATIEQSNCNIC